MAMEQEPIMIKIGCICWSCEHSTGALVGGKIKRLKLWFQILVVILKRRLSSKFTLHRVPCGLTTSRYLKSQAE